MKPEVFERRCAEMREKYLALSLRDIQVARALKESERWKNPKRKRSEWSSRRYAGRNQSLPPVAKIPKKGEIRQKFEKISTGDLRKRETELIKEVDQMMALIPLMRSALRHIRMELRIRESLSERPPRAKAVSIKYPEKCPRCSHAEVVRAGTTGSASRRQMFRCKKCNSTFVNLNDGLGVKRKEFNLLCHRCGGVDVENRGPGRRRDSGGGGGRQGYCFTCKKGFLQGGVHHLNKHLSELELRVRSTGLPADIRSEVLQDASIRVINGEGYVHNIELRVPAAYRESRGKYGEKGSSHPVFRLHQGQPPFED